VVYKNVINNDKKNLPPFVVMGWVVVVMAVAVVVMA
jgi:hypothetical protein